MPPVGFEPTTFSGERPKPYALGRVATGTGSPEVVDYNETVISVYLLLN